MNKSRSDVVYEENYGKLLNTGIVGFIFKLTHKSLEIGLKKRTFDRVLEIGAGQGQHLTHVKHAWTEYVETDIRLENLIAATALTRPVMNVHQEAADAQDLHQFSDESFDRVIVSCVLAHLPNQERALEEWRRVTKPGGTISIYIPSEPGMLLRLSRNLSTVPKAKRMGQDHLAFHYREHVNHFPAMKMLVKYVFREDQVKIRTFPAPFLSWNFSLWKVAQINKAENSNEKS